MADPATFLAASALMITSLLDVSIFHVSFLAVIGLSKSKTKFRKEITTFTSQLLEQYFKAAFSSVPVVAPHLIPLHILVVTAAAPTNTHITPLLDGPHLVSDACAVVEAFFSALEL